MNREIKFRGQCSISGDMVYGDLIQGVGSKKGKRYILPHAVNLAYVKHCDPLDGVNVNPETIGQYTGLKDKNGKEIYFDDIVKTPLGIGVIVWMGTKTGIGSGAISHYHAIDEISKIELETSVVIGNIYENPELINH